MKVKITRRQMVEIIRQTVKGTTAVSVDLDSDMDGKGKMRLTNNPFAGKGIVKRETLTGMIGYDYGSAVNRLAIKEGEEQREAKPHPWGDMDEQRLFRVNRKTGELYLSMMVRSVSVHGFFAPDGTEIDNAAIRQFIPEKTKSSTQADLDGEVSARDYKLANIMAIRAFGGEYELTNIPALEPVAQVKTAAALEPAPAA